MSFRSSVQIVVASLATAVGILPAALVVAQSTAAQTPAPGGASTDVLTDDYLRALGIERDWLQNNAPLKQALADAVAGFIARDGKATLDNLEKAVKADQSLPPHELLLARLLIASNDLDNGRRRLDLVAARHKDCPEVFLLLGNLALGEGRFTDAYLEYTRAGELAGGSAASGWSDARRSKFLREVYSGKVAVFEQMQIWDRALDELYPWRQMDGTDPIVFLREGRIRYQEGVKPGADDASFDTHYDSALAQFQEAYKLQKEQRAKGIREDDPVIERPEIVMLQLHTSHNKLERARAEIAKIDADEQNIRTQDSKEAGRIFTQISIWYLRQGEFDEARKYATRATELDKDSPALKNLSAMLAYYANDPKAEEDFAKMNAESPGDFFASNYLALIRADSDDPAKRNRAVQLAEMNYRLQPQSAEALSTLGWCYYNVGRYQEALKAMSAFTQGAQISPDTAYYFAKILVDVNQTVNQDVIGLLRSATAAKGPFKHRTEAETWLAALTGKTPAPAANRAPGVGLQGNPLAPAAGLNP